MAPRAKPPTKPETETDPAPEVKAEIGAEGEKRIAEAILEAEGRADEARAKAAVELEERVAEADEKLAAAMDQIKAAEQRAIDAEAAVVKSDDDFTLRKESLDKRSQSLDTRDEKVSVREKAAGAKVDDSSELNCEPITHDYDAILADLTHRKLIRTAADRKLSRMIKLAGLEPGTLRWDVLMVRKPPGTELVPLTVVTAVDESDAIRRICVAHGLPTPPCKFRVVPNIVAA